MNLDWVQFGIANKADQCFPQQRNWRALRYPGHLSANKESVHLARLKATGGKLCASVCHLPTCQTHTDEISRTLAAIANSQRRMAGPEYGFYRGLTAIRWLQRYHGHCGPLLQIRTFRAATPPFHCLEGLQSLHG